MSVIRLRNPLALSNPTLKALFVRAFKNEHVYVDMEAAWPDVVNMVQRDRFGVFLAEENGTFCGLSIVGLPESRLFPYPEFMNFYCEGSHKTAISLGDAVLDFIKQAGYNKVWAVNASRVSDPVWLRTFRHSGIWRLIGSLAECELK